MHRTLLVLAALTPLAATATADDRPKTVKLTLSVPGKPPVGTVVPFSGTQILPIESLTRTPRMEQEQILKDLIANTPDTEVEEKSDYLFRLGDLYAAQIRVSRERGDEAKTRDFLAKADAAFKQLTTTPAFRNYPKMDLVLFEYGYTLRSVNLEREARAAFDRLLKEFPNSKYIADAHLVVAEAAFDAGQLADAEARYTQVLKFPKATGYAYAMYKLGWLDLARTRGQEALERFFQVAQATRDEVKQAPLHEAALRDFARTYADVGKPDKALLAFKKADAIAYPVMLGAFADRLLEQGKLDAAVAAYSTVITAEPAHAEVCNWMTARAHAVAYANTKAWIDVCAGEAGVVRAWARNLGGTSN